MATANEILNFNFPHVALQEAARNIFEENNILLLELRINKLLKITESIGESSFKFEGELIDAQVYRKFNNAISNNKYQTISINNFDKKELKALSKCLDYSEPDNKFTIITSEKNLSIALATLDKDWRDIFLFGLIRCYLQNWESRHNGSLKKLYEFILPKLNQYNGRIPVLKSFQTNIKFFDINNGDVVFGNELAIKNKDIKEVTKHLSLPENWVSYPYFSKVIVAYYEKRKFKLPDFLDDLTTALTYHNSSISNKRLVSKLIIQANTNEFAALQDKVKSIAFKLVGDPEKINNWTAFESATETEKEELKKARIILNEWITRQFINVFFEKCINDRRRKKFWLKYASKISSFVVYGSKNVKTLLKSDERIEDIVEARFKTVFSNKGVSAFIIYLAEYVLIEFSDEGYAFYAYKLNGSFMPDLQQRLNSVDDLRNGIMPMLATRKYQNIIEQNSEGRLSHKDGNHEDGSSLHWEQVFDWWIKKYTGIDV